MSKKTYKVEWSASYEIVIELDFSKDIAGIFSVMNEFWDGSDERLDAYDCDIIKVGLKMLAEKAFRTIANIDFGVGYLIAKFENEEGYPPVDGSIGIEILDYYWNGLDDYDVSITEIKDE